MARSDLATDLDSVTIRQSDVEDRDIGTRRWDARLRLSGGAGLAHYLEVVLELQQLAQTTTNDLMVVEEEHPYLRHLIVQRSLHSPLAVRFRNCTD
jgi:hypothetical protein